MTEWVTAEVQEVKKWTKVLFSLYIHAPINTFIAGQFAKLAMQINNEKVQRAYSYLNAPKDPLLEFYIVAISGGKLSAKLQSLEAGQKLLITKNASGFFILNRIPDCNTLWMIATNTAIGPYLSILQQGENLERFENIVLIHAVRHYTDLIFLPLMKKLQKVYANKLRIQTIISREKIVGSLNGRIPQLIENGELEHTIGLPMTIENSHVMLCGNPEMVRDTQHLLESTRKMRKNFKNQLGHISSEHYW